MNLFSLLLDDRPSDLQSDDDASLFETTPRVVVSSKNGTRWNCNVDVRLRERRRNEKDNFMNSNKQEDDDDCNHQEDMDQDTESSSTSSSSPGLSTSPLQQKLALAKSKRHHLQTTRQHFLSTTLHQKTIQAQTLHQHCLERRVLFSDKNNKNAQWARWRRRHGEGMGRVLVELRLVVREKRRKRCCKNDMNDDTKDPDNHQVHHQFQTQQLSKSERAQQKRAHLQYLRHVHLLQCLHATHQAIQRSHQTKEYIRSQASMEIARCKERAKRVKACRLLQRFIRKKFGWTRFESTRGDHDNRLSQHGAVERLQFWNVWRGRVCLDRFMKGGGVSDLERLLQIFVREDTIIVGRNQEVENGNDEEKIDKNGHSFEEIRREMMKGETLQAVETVLECIRPMTEVSFGKRDVVTTSTTDNLATSKDSRDNTSIADGRTFLSLLLIAVCPTDVLGEEYHDLSDQDGQIATTDRSKICARLLVQAANGLLTSLSNILKICFKSSSLPSDSSPSPAPITATNTTATPFQNLRTTLFSATTLFHHWKQMDLESLLEGMKVQLRQSWVIYLVSSKTLAYMSELTGIDSSSSPRKDPLTSLRLRHEASRAGSQRHIRRLRSSLNQLVGCEEGKAVVVQAKQVALEEIRETNCLEESKMEVDVVWNGEDGAVVSQTENESKKEQDDDSEPMLAMLPQALLSNVRLVHKILLTDSQDFEKLSWDGQDTAQSPEVSVEEYMEMFTTQQQPSQENQMNLTMQIAQSMKLAFFNNIADEMEQGNYESVRGLLIELHDKMRLLLPNRKDLHSHLNDEHISQASTIVDMMQLLLRCGHLLSGYLESMARAPSTRDLLQSVDTFLASDNSSEEPSIPYGIESRHVFIVASIGFLLQKVELCQMDISNYNLARVAPLLHHIGHEYERKQFQKTFGEFENVSVESLQTMLPATWNWVKDTKTLCETEDSMAQTSFDQRMELVKSRGFVDCVLFTENELALPEIFVLDAESINHIRNEARCCVIASALVLHACKLSKAPTSILSSDYIPEEVSLAKNELSTVLRKRHSEQGVLEASIIHATQSLAKALANRDLDSNETDSLKNHVLAVLQGNDPVLKLLDNRVRSFFSFACKWRPNSASPNSNSMSPMEMKTGHSILKGEDEIRNNGVPSTKNEFNIAAQKEATRLGFAFFKSELVDAGDASRRIISLACDLYGRNVLDCFLNVQL